MCYNLIMAQFRKHPLINNQYYHVFSRSIGKFVVFNNTHEFQRFLKLLDFFRFENFNYKYSEFNELGAMKQIKILDSLYQDPNVLVEIVAFCLMPTHFHLILKQKNTNGISSYISRVLNGYARYFNVKHRRTGPLWAGRFKDVLVNNDKQMLHLTRYVHLNPISANLVKNPEEWQFSSCKLYISSEDSDNYFCVFREIISRKPKEYEKFINDRKSYQRELSEIKNLMIDNCTG